MGSQAIDKERKEERIRPKKRELHGLLYTKIVKSGTIRLASVLCFKLHINVQYFLGRPVLRKGERIKPSSFVGPEPVEPNLVENWSRSRNYLLNKYLLSSGWRMLEYFLWYYCQYTVWQELCSWSRSRGRSYGQRWSRSRKEIISARQHCSRHILCYQQITNSFCVVC